MLFRMKHLLFILVPAFLTIALFNSCGNDGPEELKPFDLLPYGVALTILAPDSADVKVDDLFVMKDITVKKGDDYYVQILSSNAGSNDLAKLLSDQRNSVKEHQYFSRFIEDKPNGFIYEMIIDSTEYSYDFRHVRVKGDKEYICQTGLIGSFTLEEAKRMYDSIDYEVQKK